MPGLAWRRVVRTRSADTPAVRKQALGPVGRSQNAHSLTRIKACFTVVPRPEPVRCAGVSKERLESLALKGLLCKLALLSPLSGGAGTSSLRPSWLPMLLSSLEDTPSLPHSLYHVFVVF